jgi:hypothetical protein
MEPERYITVNLADTLISRFFTIGFSNILK